MKKVQYEEMLPHEFMAALASFPVAYVPVGSLEWHGCHLPYGVDTFLARGILIKVARKFGGIVVPPIYWGRMDFELWKDYINKDKHTGTHPGLPPELLAANSRHGKRNMVKCNGCAKDCPYDYDRAAPAR